jgi:hypothetical protein
MLWCTASATEGTCGARVSFTRQRPQVRNLSRPPAQTVRQTLRWILAVGRLSANHVKWSWKRLECCPVRGSRGRRPRGWEAPPASSGRADPTARRSWASTVVVRGMTAADRDLGHVSTAGLEPDTHDLQAKFVKTAERAQVRADEGSVRHVAPIGHPRHEQVSSRVPSRPVS